MNKNLLNLTSQIYDHKAVNNEFYKKWVYQKLSNQQIAIFARNYWEWTYHFPEALAGLIFSINDLNARIEHTKTLYSEMGNGNSNKAHVFLFENFCNHLSEAIEKPGFLNIEHLKHKYSILESTNDLIHWQKEFYLKNYVVGTGAQLALEWQAYTMMRQLYEGARNYYHLWKNQDEFHEACEFFYVHISATEKDHKEESMLATKKLIEAGADVNEIKFGFETMLNLIANFWDGIAKSF